MVIVRLLGEAGRRFGRVFRLAVRSASEAVRALCVQIPELRQYMLDSGQAGINWRVVTEDPLGLTEDELEWPCSKRVVIAPQPAGRGGVGKIIAGVALVAAAIFALPALLGGAVWAGSIGYGTAVGIINATTLLGVGLIFSGVADLLTPTPKMPGVGSIGGARTDASSTDQQRSSLFDKSNANTAQGDVVPVLYGERMIGSLPILAFGIEIQNSL